MNAKVREAAERCRDMVGATSIDFENASVDCVRDMWRLAEAYLEQNPEDDEELITREWVYDNMTITGYGAKINDCLYLKQSKAGWGVYAFDANSEFADEEFLVARVTTRRDLRGLLRGLGHNTKG